MSVDSEIKDFLEVIRHCAGGNMGANLVLTRIVQELEVDLVPVLAQLIGTKSKGPYIWILFKDACGQDLLKTWEQLKKWKDESTDPLEVWLASWNNEARLAFDYETKSLAGGKHQKKG